MKVARCYRWDLVVGGAAALIAIAGLGLSVALGNTETIAAGTITGETQRAVLRIKSVRGSRSRSFEPILMVKSAENGSASNRLARRNTMSMSALGRNRT